MPAWEIIITGCGTSHGNPPWGYPKFWSEDPRDHRRRAGAVLRGPAGQVLLVDAGPDLAHQMKDPDRTWDGRTYPKHCITHCDGVLLTHDHADHSHGINDLRHLNRLMNMRTINVYGNNEHLQALVQMFPYCFGFGEEMYENFLPALRTVAMTDGQPTRIADLEVTALATYHGPAGRTTAFRCGNLGYLTDFKILPPGNDALLQNLDVLVLDMLREREHETHLSWPEALEVIKRLRAKRTVLTHMGVEVKYAEWEKRLPDGVIMAYDGLRLPFSAT